MWIPWARALVFRAVLRDEASLQTSAVRPRDPTAGTHSETERRAFWLREAQPSSFFWALQQLPACFPEINGLSILGRQ